MAEKIIIQRVDKGNTSLIIEGEHESLVTMLVLAMQHDVDVAAIFMTAAKHFAIKENIPVSFFKPNDNA